MFHRLIITIAGIGFTAFGMSQYVVETHETESKTIAGLAKMAKHSITINIHALNDAKIVILLESLCKRGVAVAIRVDDKQELKHLAQRIKEKTTQSVKLIYVRRLPGNVGTMLIDGWIHWQGSANWVRGRYAAKSYITELRAAPRT